MTAIKYSCAFMMIFFIVDARAQLKENFSDGDFIANPVWSGMSSMFKVNPSFQLQTNATEAGIAWLSTSCSLSSLEDVHWQTSVRQSFSSSGSNYGRVYLVSDQADLTLPLHGYYLQFGEAGNVDAIQLFRQDGDVSVSVFRGAPGKIASSFNVRVDITYHSGKWTLMSDYSGENNLQPDADGIDSTYSRSLYFGFRCAFTSSNATKFYYDDIMIGVAPATTDPNPVAAKKKALIITEIFPDPEPSVGLPNAEYVEIFNRSNVACNLSGWTISDGTTSGILPNINLLPHTYGLILSPSGAIAFSAFPNKIVSDKLPTLNNDSDNIILKTPLGATIDSIHYSVDWFHDPEKSDGGWSLELIDSANVCGEGDNWAASENALGGTPGQQNSVLASKPDVVGPSLVSCTPLSLQLLELRFSEKLADNSCAVGGFFLSPALRIHSIHFASSSGVPPNTSTLSVIILELVDQVQAGVRYVVTTNNIHDCNGNEMQAPLSLTFAWPEPADSLDLLINEVLFDPKPVGVDFLEIYNASQKFISLTNAKLANVENGILKNASIITTDHLTIAPHAWLCFTSDTIILKSNFLHAPTENFFQCRIPSLPNDEGSVALVSAEGAMLDLFFYTDKLHSRLLQNREGVSLERISLAFATNDSQNWTSASSQSGYGTPGAPNSCYVEGTSTIHETVAVEPILFAPLSGNTDFTRILYHLSEPGYIGSVKIVDQQARVIRNIASNELLGMEGFFRWEGDQDDGTVARAGYYVAWLQIFDLSGHVRTFRRRVVVAAR